MISYWDFIVDAVLGTLLVTWLLILPYLIHRFIPGAKL